MSGLHIARLTVEGAERPLGIDVPRPRFGWVLEGAGEGQPSSLTVTLLDADGSTIWTDTVSGESVRASPDADLALRSLTEYSWRVEAGSDVVSESAFETGLLDDAGWARAAWIGGAPQQDNAPAPLLRGSLEILGTVLRARLVVAAGGLASVSVNGRMVNECLSPGLTDYDDRVHYVVHDVTDLVTGGTVVVAAALGRGFFGMTTENTWNWHRAPWHGDPRLRAVLQIDTDRGTQHLVTGADFVTSRGGTLADSFYEGEVFDTDREPHGWREVGFDDGTWEPAAVVPAPKGRLVSRRFPGIRVSETLHPRSIEARGNGHFVLDFGHQIAGWLRVDLPASAGAEVVLTSAERLVDGDPVIDTPFSAGDFQIDRVISGGAAVLWEPQFGYKGFQYVDVRGWPSDQFDESSVIARRAHTDLERTARFTSSEPLLTWIHEAAVATVENNLHHIPTDTPAYEKNGWTGDAALGAEMMLRDLDSAAFLEEWIATVSDSRDSDGRPALIAPSPDWFWPEHMEAPPWHAAYTTIPWRIYEATGDDRVLREHAEGIFRYLRLEHRLASDGLSETGLGDYLAPDKRGNPDEDLRVCATVAVHDGTVIGAKIAALLGDTDTEREFVHRAETIRQAFRREFFDENLGVVRDAVAGYRQTHNILALDSGMLAPGDEQRVAAALARDVDVHRQGHLWVGALGVRRALPVLDTFGHHTTAYRAATATDFPSWGHWREQGATTMWEYWDDQRSRNHYFFGTVNDWLFAHVAGVRLTSPGYRTVSIKPDHLDHLDHAEAHIRTVRGDLAVSWERDASGGVVRVEVPHGTEASIDLPGVHTRATTGRHEFRFDNSVQNTAETAS